MQKSLAKLMNRKYSSGYTSTYEHTHIYKFIFKFKQLNKRSKIRTYIHTFIHTYCTPLLDLTIAHINMKIENIIYDPSIRKTDLVMLAFDYVVYEDIKRRSLRA